MAGKRRHWTEMEGRFWARIAIPIALRPFVKNMTQLTESLVGDLKTADRKHAATLVRLQKQLEIAGRSLSCRIKEVAEAPDDRPISGEDIQRTAWDHYQSELARIEQTRVSTPTATDLQHELYKKAANLEA